MSLYSVQIKIDGKWYVEHLVHTYDSAKYWIWRIKDDYSRMGARIPDTRIIDTATFSKK